MEPSSVSTPQKTIPDAPTYSATLEDMEDLTLLISKVSALAHRYGAVRIDPPSSWKRPPMRMRSDSRFFVRMQSLPEAPFVIPPPAYPSTPSRSSKPSRARHISHDNDDETHENDDATTNDVLVSTCDTDKDAPMFDHSSNNNCSLAFIGRTDHPPPKFTNHEARSSEPNAPSHMTPVKSSNDAITPDNIPSSSRASHHPLSSSAAMPPPSEIVNTLTHPVAMLPSAEAVSFETSVPFQTADQQNKPVAQDTSNSTFPTRRSVAPPASTELNKIVKKDADVAASVIFVNTDSMKQEAACRLATSQNGTKSADIKQPKEHDHPLTPQTFDFCSTRVLAETIDTGRAPNPGIITRPLAHATPTAHVLEKGPLAHRSTFINLPLTSSNTLPPTDIIPYSERPDPSEELTNDQSPSNTLIHSTAVPPQILVPPSKGTSQAMDNKVVMSGNYWSATAGPSKETDSLNDPDISPLTNSTVKESTPLKSDKAYLNNSCDSLVASSFAVSKPLNCCSLEAASYSNRNIDGEPLNFKNNSETQNHLKGEYVPFNRSQSLWETVTLPGQTNIPGVNNCTAQSLPLPSGKATPHDGDGSGSRRHTEIVPSQGSPSAHDDISIELKSLPRVPRKHLHSSVDEWRLTNVGHVGRSGRAFARYQGGSKNREIGGRNCQKFCRMARPGADRSIHFLPPVGCPPYRHGSTVDRVISRGESSFNANGQSEIASSNHISGRVGRPENAFELSFRPGPSTDSTNPNRLSVSNCHFDNMANAHTSHSIKFTSSGWMRDEKGNWTSKKYVRSRTFLNRICHSSDRPISHARQKDQGKSASGTDATSFPTSPQTNRVLNADTFVTEGKGHDTSDGFCSINRPDGIRQLFAPAPLERRSTNVCVPSTGVENVCLKDNQSPLSSHFASRNIVASILEGCIYEATNGSTHLDPRRNDAIKFGSKLSHEGWHEAASPKETCASLDGSKVAALQDINDHEIQEVSVRRANRLRDRKSKTKTCEEKIDDARNRHEKCLGKRKVNHFSMALSNQDEGGKLIRPIVFPDSPAPISLSAYKKEASSFFDRMRKKSGFTIHSILKSEREAESDESRTKRVVEVEKEFFKALRCGVNGERLTVSYGVDVESEGAFDCAENMYVEWHGTNPGSKNDSQPKMMDTDFSSEQLQKSRLDLNSTTNSNLNLEEEIVLEEGHEDESDADLMQGDKILRKTQASPRWTSSNVGNVNKTGLLRHLPKMPGINHSMFYIGQLFTRFCWHTEDAYLNSVSYLHDVSEGEKVWYAVPPKDAESFEEYTKVNIFSPEIVESKSDAQCLLMNKTTISNPLDLLDNSIEVYRVIHKVGSFVLTAPRAYHAGFNCGFNVAEAVNFALAPWFPVGREAGRFARSVLRPLCVPWEYLLFHEAKFVCEMYKRGLPSNSVERTRIKNDARVIALELRDLLQRAEQLIHDYSYRSNCRVVMLKDVPLVTKFTELGPQFGHGAGMGCIHCNHTCHFFAGVCGSCEANSNAKCIYHLGVGPRVCRSGGHKMIIVRRHDPVMLLDILETLERLGSIELSVEQKYNRFKKFVRPWETPMRRGSGLRLQINLIEAASRIPPDLKQDGSGATETKGDGKLKRKRSRRDVEGESEAADPGTSRTKRERKLDKKIEDDDDDFALNVPRVRQKHRTREAGNSKSGGVVMIM